MTTCGPIRVSTWPGAIVDFLSFLNMVFPQCCWIHSGRHVRATEWPGRGPREPPPTGPVGRAGRYSPSPILAAESSGRAAMSDAHLFAIGVVLAWLAGIRVYLTVFGVGLAGALGWLDLPSALQVTQSPWVIGVSGALAAVEFFADKIPGVDSG